ncbi:MAG: hypothetical protein K6G48_06335, partial [Acholeplasmatales bacterium]|nr:hypothetical protein [Acholeplasmatales bacterium]
YVYCSPFAFYISRNSSSYEIHAFEINDSDKQYFENLDIDLSQTIYEERLSELRDDAELANKTVLILAVVMVSICIVYIYFTMRAHMIADIYEIGVLRNIGCSRKRLVGRYAIQSIVAVGTTAIFGYLGYMIIYGGINQYIRNLMGSSGYNLFGSMYPYYGILALFGISLVFGTLPIFTLLGKTPSEISAKYDI